MTMPTSLLSRIVKREAAADARDREQRRQEALTGDAMETECGPPPFLNNEQILEYALRLDSAREAFLPARRNGMDAETWAVQRKSVEAMARRFHQRLAATPRSVYLAEVCARHRLNRTEVDIVMIGLLDRLGLSPHTTSEVKELLQRLALPPARMLGAMRMLSRTGKLFRAGLIYHDHPYADVCDQEIMIDPEVFHRVLERQGLREELAGLREEKDLYPLLGQLTRTMQMKSEALRDVLYGCSHANYEKWSRTQAWLLKQLAAVLDARPAWQLSRARREMRLTPEDWVVVMALLGKALHHVPARDHLFRGAGLCRILCNTPDEYMRQFERLRATAPLQFQGYIQPCGGMRGLVAESASAMEDMEYELSGRARHLLGVAPDRFTEERHEVGLKTPTIRLQDLVLTPSAREAIALALDQVKHADRLMRQWGLGHAFPYGKGATLLFYGLPGTGKTAAAEAIAHELGRCLLTADYAKIQNCYVGNTEKNIAAVFEEARQRDAVLFWDEADAMFFDRDAASRVWQASMVNLLLQQIERFEGVCILATNRKRTLDKALERRLSAKVEFMRPDRAMRADIWRKLLPEQLPLAADVRIDQLCEADLSGGEIKNVLLNAARLACARESPAMVTARDFERALHMETRDRWSLPSGRRAIGFAQPQCGKEEESCLSY